MCCLRAMIACLFVCGAAVASPAPTVDVTDATVTVASEGTALSAALADASLTLTTPARSYVFQLHVQHDDGYVRASPTGTSSVVITRTREAAGARVMYPVEGDLQMVLEMKARRGIPAIVVTSRLVNAGEPASHYYFWMWDVTFDRYSRPGSQGPVEDLVDTTVWMRLRHSDWLCLQGGDSALAVITNGIVGRAPGDNGAPFVHAIPKTRHLEKGESLDLAFAFGGVESPEAAPALGAQVRKWFGRELRIFGDAGRPSPVDYGRPAPDWLLQTGAYNGYYRGAQHWTREAFREKLSHFPLIVGWAQKPALIDRCHRAGFRVILYVNYMELLDTAIEIAARGRVYEEKEGQESLDLAGQPDWIRIDRKGARVPSAWGSQNNHPGLFYTCFHNESLRAAALEQVRGLLAMGADGVFIDNAGSVADCFGTPEQGHVHVPGRTNNEMYEQLQRDIYALVKSFGEDRIVMQNTGQGYNPSHWAYCDSQMWEACIYGAGTTWVMNEWPELKHFGEETAGAVAAGKAPVILPYIDSQPAERHRECALYSYAYARIYGFLWADWFALTRSEADAPVARALYTARLGKPVGAVRSSGPVFYRHFEHGIAVLNPLLEPVKARIPAETDKFDDVGYDRTLQARRGMLELEMEPECGRVLLERN